MVGRRVARVDAPDAWYLKGGLTAGALAAALDGRRLTAARRIGKLLLVDTDGPTVGLRFDLNRLDFYEGHAPSSANAFKQLLGQPIVPPADLDNQQSLF